MPEYEETPTSPKPLDSNTEIKEIIANTCYDAIRAALDTTCWINGNAWPRFKLLPCKMELVLMNMYGEETETFVNLNIPTHEIVPGQPIAKMTGAEIRDPLVKTVEVEIPYTPPDVLRKQHSLPIATVIRRDDGNTENKAVVFRQTRGTRGREAE